MDSFYSLDKGGLPTGTSTGGGDFQSVLPDGTSVENKLPEVATSEQVELLKVQLAQLKKNQEEFELKQSDLKITLDKQQGSTESLKRDFIAVFGLFAGLVTFLATEIQIFKTATKFSLIVGESSLLAAVLLLFGLCLYGLLSEDTKGFYKKQTYAFIAIVLLFFITGVSFYWAIGGDVAWMKHSWSR